MTTTERPPWLDAYTTRSGMPDPRLASLTARPRHCAGCGRLVLAGYDSPACADLAVADPNPLTPTLEAAAVILARPTWRLWGQPGHYELTARTPARVLGVQLVPAGPDVIVVATHDCARPPLTRTTLPTRPPQFVVDSDGPPPF
jgi:hypothetical protein